MLLVARSEGVECPRVTGPSVSQHSLSFIHFYAFTLLATTALLAQDAAKPETVPVSGPEQSLRWQRLSHKCDRMPCKKGIQARGEVTITGADDNGWDPRSDTEEKKEGQVENASSKEAFWQSELFRA
jgi:hypothetical protein